MDLQQEQTSTRELVVRGSAFLADEQAGRQATRQPAPSSFSSFLFFSFLRIFWKGSEVSSYSDCFRIRSI